MTGALTGPEITTGPAPETEFTPDTIVAEVAPALTQEKLAPLKCRAVPKVQDGSNAFSTKSASDLPLNKIELFALSA